MFFKCQRLLVVFELFVIMISNHTLPRLMCAISRHSFYLLDALRLGT